MHPPAAVEVAPSAERKGKCANTTKPTILCCCKANGILKREIGAGQGRGARQTASSLATTHDFCLYSSTQFDQKRRHGRQF